MTNVEKYLAEVQILHEKYLKELGAFAVIFIELDNNVAVYGNTCATCMVLNYLMTHSEHPHALIEDPRKKSIN